MPPRKAPGPCGLIDHRPRPTLMTTASASWRRIRPLRSARASPVSAARPPRYSRIVHLSVRFSGVKIWLTSGPRCTMAARGASRPKPAFPSRERAWRRRVRYRHTTYAHRLNRRFLDDIEWSHSPASWLRTMRPEVFREVQNRAEHEFAQRRWLKTPVLLVSTTGLWMSSGNISVVEPGRAGVNPLQLRSGGENVAHQVAHQRPIQKQTVALAAVRSNASIVSPTAMLVSGES